jgi:cytidylate kinase
MELLPVDQSGDWVTRYLDGAAPSEPDLDGDLDRLLAVTQDHRIRRAVAHYQVIWASRSEQSIVVGRVGGHLFPTAEVKLFLSVDPREQNRRFGDERVHGARLRDEADRHREHDPVHPAEGAARIDTSGRTPEEVVAIIDDLVRRRSRQ